MLASLPFALPMQNSELHMGKLPTEKLAQQFWREMN
jgi:hypothetical protein